MSTIHLSEEQFRVLGLSFEPEGTFRAGGTPEETTP